MSEVVLSGLLIQAQEDRVFLNLWFGKPMVCVRVAFHENDGNHENDENDEDNSDSYKQGIECWIRGNHGNHENDENHWNPGCKPRVPQTTGLEIPERMGLQRMRLLADVHQQRGPGTQLEPSDPFYLGLNVEPPPHRTETVFQNLY